MLFRRDLSPSLISSSRISVGTLASAIVAAVTFFASASASSADAQAVQAVYGDGFGVATVTLPVEGKHADAALATDGFALRSETAWVGYPVFAPTRVGPLLQEIIGPFMRGSGNVTVRFLFQSPEPFTATIYTPAPHDVSVVPRQANPRQFARQVNEWRRAYDAQFELLEEPFPPTAEAYLRNMLPARYGLAAPPAPSAAPESELGRIADLLAGSERLRVEAVRTAFLRQQPPAPATRPLPPPIAWRPLLISPEMQANEVESIAMGVPEECFYVRFGSFQNYLWLEKLIEENGGDLSRMLTLRGTSLKQGGFAQRQLGLRKNELADWFGSSLIDDVAVIGRDLYVQDGAAIGVMFLAKSDLLQGEFEKTRRRVLAEQKDLGAELNQVEIAGHPVSLLATPGGELRSYYAVAGKYHLQTSSRAIVERFFAAVEGDRPLGSSPEFRNARRLLPIERDDTVFGFFSSEFFRQALDNETQIELARRQASRAELEILELARLAAMNEGLEDVSIESLVAARFLPVGFGQRPDGSQLLETEGAPVDSLRGPLGAFVPIADMPIESLTPEEEALALSRKNWFETAGQDIQPLSFAMRRYLLSKEPRIERVAFDVNLSPLQRERMGWMLGMLGTQSNVFVPPAEGDAIHVQANVAGSPRGRVGPHTMFLGVQNVPAKGDLVGAGFLKAFQTIRSAPAYLGTYPKAGWLDLLPGAPGPAEAGYQRLLFGLYRWQQPEFSVVGFHPELLDRVRGQIRPTTSEQMAIGHLSIQDLTDADVGTWVNALYLDRALTISDGNARFLHRLSEQFGLPRQEAPAVAERILGAELVDTLGGEYVLFGAEEGPGIWRSSITLEKPMSEIEFHAPVLDWFRGATATLSERDAALWLHTEIDMERKPLANDLAPFKLPDFQLPFWNRSGSAPSGDAAPERPPADPAPRADSAAPADGVLPAKPPTEELPPPEPLPRPLPLQAPGSGS
ncbi:MAG TPA: hypothetical protein VGN57_04760 [Pirellulaceae bacterium]|nr:hypothetical protein [Pirellulaceae bacterium]